MELWDDICDNFNLAVMLQSETGSLDRKVLSEVEQAIKLRWLFPAIAELFRAFAEIIEFYGSALEGCHCHAEVWTKKRKFESKLAELQQLTGFRHCCWKGRQGSWWVAKGFREMITRIANCKSQKFDELVQKCLPPIGLCCCVIGQR
jgi:hypothetical protein